VPEIDYLNSCPKRKECYKWLKTDKSKDVLFPKCPYREELERLYGDFDQFESLREKF
jgi:hypothetical protein